MDMRQIKDKLKEYKTETGQTHQQIANAASIDLATVSRILSGKATHIRIQTANKLQNLFNQSKEK